MDTGCISGRFGGKDTKKGRFCKRPIIFLLQELSLSNFFERENRNEGLATALLFEFDGTVDQ